MTSISAPTPGYAPLSARAMAELQDADVGRLIRRKRIGILCFWGLTFMSVNNINALALMSLGTERMFSYPMLIFLIVVLISFQFALIRDLGTTGLLYLLFLVTYLGVSLPLGIQSISIDTYVRVHWIRMLSTSFAIMAACALGTRHVTLAWSKRRLLFWLYLITLGQVAMIFLGMAFPKYLYGETGMLSEGRFTGFFRNPNEAGIAACMSVAVAFAYLTVAKRKAWVFVAMMISAVATVLTFSRSSFLVLFMVIVMQVLISPIIKRKSILIAVMLGMGFLTWFATVGVFSVVDVSSMQNKRLASLQRILTFDFDVEEDSGSRFEAAYYAIQHWLDSPIIGNGFTTMRNMPETGLGPHNQYLLVLGEGGILALGAMLLFIFVFALTSWNSKDRTARSLGMGVIFVYCCACMVNHTVYTNRADAALLGICMGLFAAVSYRTKVLQGAVMAANTRNAPPANPAAIPSSRYGQPALPRA